MHCNQVLEELDPQYVAHEAVHVFVNGSPDRLADVEVNSKQGI